MVHHCCSIPRLPCILLQQCYANSPGHLGFVSIVPSQVKLRGSLPRSQFFLNGKTLPIERGHGPQQPAMQTAAELLAHGDWVHVFPEGRVGYSGRLQACKWGVGKLVCDTVAHSGR